MPAWEPAWKKAVPVTHFGTMPATLVTSTARFAATLQVGNVMPDLHRIAVLGGIYSNHLALAAALDDVKRRGVDACYCVGDVGAFGPHPDRIFPLLQEAGVVSIQGNYDN